MIKGIDGQHIIHQLNERSKCRMNGEFCTKWTPMDKQKSEYLNECFY